MAVPSPSIKPALIAGGVHRALYMGPVGASSNPQPADSALGIVRVRPAVAGETPAEPPSIGTTFTGPGGLNYTAFEGQNDGDDFLMAVRAEETGPQYNLPAGTHLTANEIAAGWSTDAVAEYDFFGGANESAASGVIHIDLTALSPAVRVAPYFADQLMVWIQPLDAGITDVQPQVIRPEDLHGPANQPPEYLTLNVTNDADANQWVVWVHAPHSHHR